uniref:Uncharacterized protein n=1 Tax=Fagus sylvatica TaxID=28930 RepID=A0A2N9F0D7_FAGSY
MGFGGVGLGLLRRGLWWVWVCRRGYGGFGWLPWDSVAWVWVPAWVWWVWVVAMGFGGVGLGGPAWVWVCRHGCGGGWRLA